ncbi:hypothetical protein AVEN_12607-2-1, partial [Araneus ventricosus]
SISQRSEEDHDNVSSVLTAHQQTDVFQEDILKVDSAYHLSPHHFLDIFLPICTPERMRTEKD